MSEQQNPKLKPVPETIGLAGVAPQEKETLVNEKEDETIPKKFATPEDEIAYWSACYKKAVATLANEKAKRREAQEELTTFKKNNQSSSQSIRQFRTYLALVQGFAAQGSFLQTNLDEKKLSLLATHLVGLSQVLEAKAKQANF